MHYARVEKTGRLATCVLFRTDYINLGQELTSANLVAIYSQEGEGWEAGDLGPAHTLDHIVRHRQPGEIYSSK